MDKKEASKLIEKIVELLKEDPLKAWIYLRGQELSQIEVHTVEKIWIERDNARKEIDKLLEGSIRFERKIAEELGKVKIRERKRLYQEFFGNKKKNQ